MERPGYEPVVDAIRDLVVGAAGHVVFVGVAGSVCVGKIDQLCAHAAQCSIPIASEIVTTDGFLLPKHELAARGLTTRKGFPESYDAGAIRTFLHTPRSGLHGLTVPCYSHERYDVVPGRRRPLGDAAVLVFEGVNALQFADLLDLSIYLDAPEAAIESWYVERLLDMFAVAPPGSFYAELGFDEGRRREFAHEIWSGINHANLTEHILPTSRPRRDRDREGGRPLGGAGALRGSGADERHRLGRAPGTRAAAVELTDGDTRVMVVPELGMLVASFVVDGFDHVRARVASPRSAPATRAGLPLLYPWANRLARSAPIGPRVATCRLRGMPLHTDAFGLPIHGTMLARPEWEIAALGRGACRPASTSVRTKTCCARSRSPTS